MSRDNVELVRQVQAAYEERGLAGFVGALAAIAQPSVEWVEDPSWPGAQTYVGVEAVGQRLAEAFAVLPVRQVVDEYIDAGDRVVSMLRWQGVGETSGAGAEMKLATVSTFKDDELTRVRVYFDREEALQAVGLSE